MNKQKTMVLVAKKMKLVRIENGYTQEKMADILGISKKTLVQIEKERVIPSWTTVVAVCALFADSEILVTSFGGNPLEIVTVLARESVAYQKKKTLGGKIWWKELGQQGSYRLQQNIISQHYRIVDSEDYRWFSTFQKEAALAKFEELVKS